MTTLQWLHVEVSVGIGKFSAMTTLYIIRHTESVANVNDVLAGQCDFPLSVKGKSDAVILAKQFAERYSVSMIWCSPLLRAQQTAAPFVVECNAPLFLDRRLVEQNLGRFSGMTYAEAEADPGYCRDRLARWDWEAEGGGESYRMIADRVQSFLDSLRAVCIEQQVENILVVTHAVTLRLFRACLEHTLPNYPQRIAANGEIWQTKLSIDSAAEQIREIKLSLELTAHRP